MGKKQVKYYGEIIVNKSLNFLGSGRGSCGKSLNHETKESRFISHFFILPQLVPKIRRCYFGRVISTLLMWNSSFKAYSLLECNSITRWLWNKVTSFVFCIRAWAKKLSPTMGIRWLWNKITSFVFFVSGPGHCQASAC